MSDDTLSLDIVLRVCTVGIAEIRAELEELRQQLAAELQQLAAEVRTRRLVVESPDGDEVIYTKVTDSHAQLCVAWDGDRGKVQFDYAPPA